MKTTIGQTLYFVNKFYLCTCTVTNCNNDKTLIKVNDPEGIYTAKHWYPENMFGITPLEAWKTELYILSRAYVSCMKRIYEINEGINNRVPGFDYERLDIFIHKRDNFLCDSENCRRKIKLLTE